MTLGPERWCLLVGDEEIRGPITGRRHGWPFVASIENLGALEYEGKSVIRWDEDRDTTQDLLASRAASHSTIISPNFAGL
jgi:hypothetical protein